LPIDPPTRPAYDAAATAAREALGETGFAAAEAAGRALSLDEAVAEALAVAGTDSEVSPSTTHNHGADHGLTPREVEVLRLLPRGLSNPAIAEALFVSRRSVQTHLTHIYGKLGVATRAEAIAYAVQHGLA
jgi:DNA-binding NarL/FixJ family response regulator